MAQNSGLDGVPAGGGATLARLVRVPEENAKRISRLVKAAGINAVQLASLSRAVEETSGLVISATQRNEQQQLLENV